jgi:hypothetical protein
VAAANKVSIRALDGACSANFLTELRDAINSKAPIAASRP